MRTYACQMIVVALGWPELSWNLDLDRPIHKATTTNTKLGKSPQTTIQSEILPKPTLSQSLCLASVLEKSYVKNSHSQWQIEITHLTDFREESTNQRG